MGEYADLWAAYRQWHEANWPPLAEHKEHVHWVPPADPCPWCGTQLRAKWSGVACPREGCGYWHCEWLS